MYLKRTPSSTGSRLKATWSFWIKRNKLNPTTSQYLFYSDNGGASADAARFNDDDGGDSMRLLFWDGTSNNAFINVDKLRDTSSWQHYLIVYDSTLGTFDGMSNNDQTLERMKLYINGRRMIETGGNSTQNQGITSINQLLTHWGVAGSTNSLFATGNDANGTFITTFDAFYVDGQALTPDIFGYNKEGKGYISAGISRQNEGATDYRPGQWLPRNPKTIKSEINRRGGFGSNGYYLPLNDGSNFGADFHCVLDTIIKLKGEDEPQPRNGAPTTTDSYVSQLREDPYSANIALAIPGAHSKQNLVTNGGFDTNTSGWTGDSGAVITWRSGGYINVNYGGGDNTFAIAQTGVLQANSPYTLSFRVRPTITGAYEFRVRAGGSSTQWSVTTGLNSGDWNYIETGIIIADGTTLEIGTLSGNIQQFDIDDIVLKRVETPADYSANIRGSGSNITYNSSSAQSKNRIVDDIPSFYGSAITTDNPGASLFYNLDGTDYGTNDWTFECWFYGTSEPNTWGILLHHATNTSWQNGITLVSKVNTTRTFGIFLGDSTGSTLTISSDHIWNFNQWYHVAAERHGNFATLYVDGVAHKTRDVTGRNYDVADLPSVSSSYAFTIGGDGNRSFPTYGYFSDIRVYKGVAKYKGGFDVPKQFSPSSNMKSWRACPDTTANNFATFNPLMVSTNGTGTTLNQYSLSNGNLTASCIQTNHAVSSNFSVSSGKWYWEIRVDVFGADNLWMGIVDYYYGGGGGYTTPQPVDTNYFVTPENNELILYASSGNYYRGSTPVSTGTRYDEGDIVGFSIDLDTDGNTTPRLGLYVNGTLVATSTGSMPGTPKGSWRPMVAFGGGSDVWVVTANFGQNPTFCGATAAGTYTDSNGRGAFMYQPPSGFLAMCSANLPEPAIQNPGDHFKTVLYTGYSTPGRHIDVGFKPDLVWLKSRNTAVSHVLQDSVRGVFSHINANGDNPESIQTSPYLSSFDSTGFSLNDGSVSGGNTSGRTYVAWCWKAGGPAVTNNDGSIQSQVSVNQDAGFSIVSYTYGTGAQTIGHGLNKAPDFIMMKNLSAINNWDVYHSGIGPQYRLLLNDVSSKQDYTEPWNDTAPDNSVFHTNGWLANGSNVIAYCWTEIPGFSSFGRYIGTGQAEGIYIHLGFKPAFVMVKSDTLNNGWNIVDSARDPVNGVYNNILFPDTTDFENFNANKYWDFTSNGMKARGTSNGMNAQGQGFVYAAFAESPFKYANAK
jgi:hypothetical protein